MSRLEDLVSTMKGRITCRWKQHLESNGNAENPTWIILGRSRAFECKKMGMVFVLNGACKLKTSGVHVKVAANASVKIVAARFAAKITRNLTIYFFEESEATVMLLMFQ